jgi:NADH:ubiquinone oxidoreductase subunit E
MAAPSQISVCEGKSCTKAGSDEVVDHIQGMADYVVDRVGCQGACNAAVTVILDGGDKPNKCKNEVASVEKLMRKCGAIE